MSMQAESSAQATTGVPRPRRVFIYALNFTPEPTGAGRYTGEIAAYLTKQGAKVEVVTAVPHYPGWTVRSGYRNRYSNETTAGMRITRCPLFLKTEMAGIWRVMAPLSFALTSGPVALWRILEFRPDAILCVEPTLLSAPIALMAAKIIRARTILHVQDLEIDAAFSTGHLRSGFARKCLDAIERRILRWFDSVVTISSRMRDRLKFKGVSPGRLAIVRNWVDLEKIKPLLGPSPYRRELGLSDGMFVALYAGNIGAKQALPVVLDAAEGLASDPEVAFVIAGEGPAKRQLMERYGRLPNVSFIPVQPEERFCELLNSADVHLLPQDGAAEDFVFPSKLGAMLASGKPCIVTANPGSELFEFLGDGALIVPPGDSLALGKAIEQIKHERDRIFLGCNSRRIAALDARQNLAAFAAILVETRLTDTRTPA